MNVRTARPADRPAIRDIARRSLQASYSLEPQAITTAIEEWYGEERLAEAIAADDHVHLVAVLDDQLVGFSETQVTDDVGTMLWLHVDPAHREQGIGDALFSGTREHLTERGVDTFHGRVLADNVEGNIFYSEQGFSKAAEDTVEIAGRTYTENHYVDAEAGGREAVDTGDGRTVYVDHDASERGSVGTFHAVFETPEGEERYGYYCGNCHSLANAMDAMGRIECDECGNARKPTRWDAAYL